ncbi:hypothetical protein ACLB2K_010211 [Fragaria x ananassa]
MGESSITDRAKKDAIKKAARAAELMVEAVNGGVQEAFVKEKRSRISCFSNVEIWELERHAYICECQHGLQDIMFY